MLEAGGGVMAALEALLRLRQAACHTSLLPSGMISKKGKKGKAAKPAPSVTNADGESFPVPQYAEDGTIIGSATEESLPTGDAPLLGSSKVTRLINALEDAVADGHKALVFSQWTSLLDLIEPHLNGAKIAFNRLDGTTKDRAAVVNQFQAADGPPVMLLSLKAGGTGLNLTAADHVFLVDPWWNPAVEEQAADRAHRIGQDRPVMVYRLVARDTVEERILVLQDAKRNLADAALGQADRATAITREDLLALLA
jgi:SNF2 family DNA or RNA helicase